MMSEIQTKEEDDFTTSIIETNNIIEFNNNNIIHSFEALLPAKRVRRPVDLEYQPKQNYYDNAKTISNNNYYKKEPKQNNHETVKTVSSTNYHKKVKITNTATATGHKEHKRHYNKSDLRNNQLQSIVKNVIETKTNTYIPPSVALSGYDKATQLKLSNDFLLCSGYEGGYRMVRATHGVHRGSYYWEVEVLPHNNNNTNTTDTGTAVELDSKVPSNTPHYRIGWSTRQGELQAPVGFDQYSYAYRDIHGSKIHNSKRVDNYGDSYTVGDVIGCHIILHEDESYNKMSFFKNGVDQGIAYSGSEISTGLYFPAISLYMKAKIRVNFGPSFIKKHDIYGANAISELQPMNPDDRKQHELMIQSIKNLRGE